MDRYKRQIRLRCDRGLPIKRDTPVKPALTRRDSKKNTVIHILTQSTFKYIKLQVIVFLKVNCRMFLKEKVLILVLV